MLRASLLVLGLLSFGACGPAAEPESDASQAAALEQFHALDVTEDGFLSGSEAKDLGPFDRNNDGRIEQAEFVSQASGGRTKGPGGDAEFDRLDANEDGKLSGTEAVDFEQFDQDGDGRITRAEFSAGQAGAANPGIATAANASAGQPAAPQRPPTAWDQKLAGQFDGGKKWAVLIGVNRYAQSPLNFCVSDNKLLADTLVKHCGYARENILLLTDDQADAKLHPNKSALQQRIPELLKKVDDKDTVLVMFSGHGFSADGQSFLCPLDYNTEQSKLSGWRADELRSMLHDCRAAQKVLLLDCCHSGGAVLLGGGGGGQVQSAAFEHAQGLITFASCKTSEMSLESAAKRQGVFTYVLTQALQGLADFDHNNIVDSDELYRQLLLEVPKLALETQPGHKQTPVRIIGQDVVGVFALARPDSRAVAAHQAALAQAEAAKPKPGDKLINSIGMRLVLLPNLLFAMGSPPDEYQRNSDESVNPIILTRSIYCGVYEVTQAEYARVMGENPSYFSAEGAGAGAVAGMPTGRFPVEQVSWGDAVAFCQKLSELPAEKAARRSYRLPTEAEWEYVCRGGTVTAFVTGDRITAADANIRGDRPYWDSPVGPYLGRPRTVGAYAPNQFGLYDLHGNVAEWCYDHYSPSPTTIYRPKNAVETSGDVPELLREFEAWRKENKRFAALHLDPTGPGRGTTRVLRGGAYTGDVSFCRSAARRDQDPEYRHRTNGFRVVCEIAPPPAP